MNLPVEHRALMGERDPNYKPDPVLESYKFPSQKTIAWFDKYYPKLEVKEKKPRKLRVLQKRNVIPWGIKGPPPRKEGESQEEPSEEAIVESVATVSDDDTFSLT